MSGISSHVYDVDLKSILRQYKAGINGIDINSSHTKEYHINLFETNIRYLCEQIQQDFLLPAIILTPDNGQSYWHYLGLSLLFYRPDGIILLLEYHLKNYTHKFNGNRTDFVNSIEYSTLVTIRNAGNFNNSERLNIITKWIQIKKRNLVSKEARLIWDENKYSVLKKISVTLKVQGYTKRRNDFHDIFDKTKGRKKKVILWTDSPESLIYLMDKLRNDPTNYITATGINKPFVKAIESQFKFYDKQRGEIERNDLKNVLHNVMKRSKDIHTQMKADIDKIISQSI